MGIGGGLQGAGTGEMGAREGVGREAEEILKINK